MANFNKNFCKPTEDGSSILYAPIALPPKMTPPTEEDYNAKGWYKNAIEAPEPPEGMMVATTTYLLDGNEVVAQYTYEDMPKPVREWTPLSIKRACGEKWPTVKTALQQADIYEDFIMAQVLKEDDEAF